MSSAHNYNTRQNSVSVNVNVPSTPENSSTLENSSFSELIMNLEKTMLMRFDGVDKELLNLKDVVIKSLQIENQRLRSKVDNLEKKVISLEENGNLLEQYGRRNNLEITGISNETEDVDLEGKVIEILDKIEVNVSSKDIEACHLIGKSKDNSKKTIIPFVNRKYAKKPLRNRKNLKHLDKSSIGISNSNNIFISENLTPMNNGLAFYCRKLKWDGYVEKEGVVCIRCRDIQDGKSIKVLHFNTLVDLFPNFDFGEDMSDNYHFSAVKLLILNDLFVFYSSIIVGFFYHYSYE